MVPEFADVVDEAPRSEFIINGRSLGRAADIITPVLELLTANGDSRVRLSGGINSRVTWLLMFNDPFWMRATGNLLNSLVATGAVSQSVVDEIGRQYDVFRGYRERYKNVPAALRPDIVSEMLGEVD